MVCLSAQLAVAPLTMYYFNQFPTLFLIGNLAVKHLFTFSLILAVLGTPFLLLDLVPTDILDLYHQLIALIHMIVKHISSYENLLLDNVYLSKGQVLGIYAGLTAAIAGWQFKKDFNWKPLGWMTVLMVIVLYLANLSGDNKGQLWVLHQTKASVLLWYENQSIDQFTDASPKRVDQMTGDFKRKYPVNEVIKDSLWRWFDFVHVRLLVLDFNTILTDTFLPKADIILLKNNPKIHLDRVINQWQPQYIIADGRNGSWDLNRWKVSCQKAGVVFYSTAEKAFCFSP